MRRPLLSLTLALTLALAAVLAAPGARAGDEVDPRAISATRAGAAAFERGNLDKAVVAFEQALAHATDADAQAVPARRNLALALSRKAERAIGRKDGAAGLDLLDRALELHPGRLRYETWRSRALLLLGRLSDALRSAQDLTTRSPTYADAWLVLADVHERAGELTAALDALSRVQALRPGDMGLGARITRVRRSAEAEERFLTHGSGHFQVRYDPDASADTVRLALTLLEDAYAQVTADLGMAPRTSARVVLYQGAEFQRVTGAHSWVGALYNNGTLRVPMRNLERHRVTAARVLAHEFSHHVLRERTPALPTWWHEGIAQFIEDDAEESARRQAGLLRQLRHQKKASRLLTLAEMRRLKISRVANAGTVNLFYAQALAFVGWLVETHGTGALPTFLTALGADTDVDAAAKRAFGEDVPTLWARWEKTL